jgi:Icc-related predicted phosphoesterase
MIIDCISDLHGHFPTLEGGDLLIIAGDLTARHTLHELEQFNEWVRVQDYKKKVLIAGNHDTFFESGASVDSSVHYLCDSGTEYEGLKIWGTPWTAQFRGINPICCAFSMPLTINTEDLLQRYWDLIPSDTDILITHSPPFGILDTTSRKQLAGSPSLLVKVSEINPLIHCFGHIHEEGGKDLWMPWKRGTTFINASLVNLSYEPVNKPVRIVL